jgi:P4 family phage/plasmid primase-like protien
MRGLGDPVNARRSVVRRYIGVGAFDPDADSDQKLAEAALERMSPALRYAADADTWLVRGEDRWHVVGRDYAATVVAQLSRLMPGGSPTAEKGSDEARRAERKRKFTTQRTAAGVASMMRSVARDPDSPVRVELSQLDSEPYVLWAGGLPYDLRVREPSITAVAFKTGPHLHTAAVTPKWGADAPCWEAFVDAVWPDPAVRDWALRVLSVALTGYSDAVLPVLIGKGGRGKSSVVDLIMSVLGSYAEPVSAKLLSGGDGHASIFYALKGLRLAFIDEGPRAGVVATETLKQLTGGTKLTGNRMRENPITFAPSHTLILTSNAEPTLTDEALRRRVRLIPCDGDPDEIRRARQAIGDVDGEVWQAEAPRVLAYLMHEAAEWLADRDSASTAAAPDSIRNLAEEIGREQDVVMQWLEDAVDEHAQGTKAGDLYRDFISWTKERAIKHPPTSTTWGRRLTELGYPGTKSGNERRRPLRTRMAGITGLPTYTLPMHALPAPA